MSGTRTSDNRRASTEPGRVVDAALLRDLGLAMALRIDEGDGKLLRAPEVRRQLARCEDPVRRRELERFVQHAQDELARILRGTAPRDVPAARRELAISVHPVQFASKLWLIDELARRCDLSQRSLIVLGGWYGMLPLLVNWRVPRPPRRMLCIDKDAGACQTGARMIGSIFPNIGYRCGDAMDLEYHAADVEDTAVVVNTICEHLEDVAGWSARVPRGRLVALQNNNYQACPDHVSCVQSLEQFREQVRLSEVLYEGVLHLPELDRFMLIGHR